MENTPRKVLQFNFGADPDHDSDPGIFYSDPGIFNTPGYGHFYKKNCRISCLVEFCFHRPIGFNMSPPLIGGGIKRCFCLMSDVSLTSDICLSRTSGLSREQRGLGRLKLAQRQPTSHVTRTSLSRSKGQSHQAALLTAALTRQAAAVVSVGTYWAWETTATLRCARWRQALRRPQRRRGAGAYRGGRPPTACHLSDNPPAMCFFERVKPKHNTS